MKFWIAFALSVLAVPLPGGAQSGASLDQLLEQFRGLPGLSARFREEKRVALLAVPIRSEGEIHFAPPGRLLRKVTAPTASTALIADGRLTFASQGQRQEFDLTRQPLVAGFVDSFRSVLAGDRAALERAYRISYRSRGEGWELTLRPRGAPLNRFLQEMSLVGQGVEVSEMRMVEVSGDATTTEFFEIDAAKRWSEAEARRVFRLPGS